MSKCKNIGMTIEYPDHRFQKLIIEGSPTSYEISVIMKDIDLDFEEYDIKENNIRNGIDGVIQVLVLYCLNERLKSRGLGNVE